MAGRLKRQFCLPIFYGDWVGPNCCWKRKNVLLIFSAKSENPLSLEAPEVIKNS